MEEWNTFFAANESWENGGITLYAGADRTSTVFNYIWDGSSWSLVETYFDNSGIKRAITAHELGHQLDSALGDASQQTATSTFGYWLNWDYTVTFNTHSCMTVFNDSTVCGGGYSGTNSQRLEAWLKNRREIFASMFASMTYPNYGVPNVELAMSYLPETETWMSNTIAGL